MASKTRHKIGRHFFLEMGPAPLFASQKVTYAVAAGVDGASIFLDGVRGEMFQVQTVVDASGERDVRQLFHYYHNMTGRIHEVRYDFQVYGDYLVDRVLPRSVEVLRVVGSVRRANPTHLVECTWDLYPIRRRFRVDELERFTVEP